jgi:hypothetical protein
MRAALWLFLLASLADAQDFQVWNEVDLTASWRKVDLLIPLLARNDNHLPNPQLAATGLTADFALPWRLTLTGGYLFADLPQRADKVHIPLIAMTKSLQTAGFVIADRNRFEKLLGYPHAPVRYRNRILADRAFGRTKGWHLFAADETFIDLSASQWSQNRFQAGGGARLNRKLSLDIYYLQKNAAGGAAPAHILGTTLRVSLTRR